jgi:uncharacterized protein YjbI with pentapeptide repeats
LTFDSLSGLTQFNNVLLADLDLSGAQLEELRVMRGSITDCRFERANCREWRLWAVTTHDTSFHRADLRGALLGGALDGREDTWHRVTFTRADMRGIVSAFASYIDCDFSHARLDRVDFYASVFVRCTFAGRLPEVIFNRTGGWAEERAHPVVNEMEDVDLSGAEFDYTEFRGLDLDRVKLPEGGDHIIVRNYRCVLERVIAELSGDSTPSARSLRVHFQQYLKWAGPTQAIGMFNAKDFDDKDDDEARTLAIRLLQAAEKRCSSN